MFVVLFFVGVTMTQQNVVVSDPKSGINLAISVKLQVPSNSPALFTTAVQKPPPAPGSCITISRKTLVEINGNNNGARINSWVDSMRASSPTHHKSTPPLSDDINSWTVSSKTKDKTLSCSYTMPATYLLYVLAEN